MALMISMVAFSQPPQLSVAEITGFLAEHWPSLPAATQASETPDTLSFRLGDADILVGNMPVPIPWSDLEGPCATSILWRDAQAALKPHQAHSIVTVRGKLEPIALSTLLTQATAAVAATSPVALGVYWGNAALVVQKALFVDFAVEVLPHDLPLPIWVDIRVGEDGAGASSGFTTGLAALGHMEIEGTKAPEPFGELRRRLEGLVGYLLERGPVIQDGDTIGEDAQERIRVVYSASAFGQGNQVMRLEYEQQSPEKPWWKVWQ